MKRNVIKEKSFVLAVEIVKLTKKLREDRRELVMSKQLLRSGTSIGANVREGEHAESKADFIHKMSIALKEANESDYWIDLLFESEYLDRNEYLAIRNELTPVLKLLRAIVKSSKENRFNGN